MEIVVLGMAVTLGISGVLGAVTPYMGLALGIGGGVIIGLLVRRYRLIRDYGGTVDLDVLGGKPR